MNFVFSGKEKASVCKSVEPLLRCNFDNGFDQNLISLFGELHDFERR